MPASGRNGAVTASHARPARLAWSVGAAGAALEVLVLWWFCASRLTGYCARVDLHTADELNYLWGGVDLLRTGDVPSLAMCPAYSLLYAALSLLPIPGHLPDAAFVFVALGAPTACWWALRALVPSPLALLAAAWFGSLTVVVQSATGGTALSGIYVFTSMLVWLATGALARGRLRTSAALFLLVALTRPEHAPWWLVAASVAAALPGFRPQRRACIATAAIAAAALLFVALHPDYRARSWLTFCQHYSVETVVQELGREWEASGGRVAPERLLAAQRELASAFAQPEPIVRRDFPGADSVVAALRIAPDRALPFALGNLRKLPDAARRALESTALPAGGNGWLLILLAALAATGWLRRRRTGTVPAGARAGAGPMLALYLAASPLAVLGAAIAAARPELTLPVVVAFVWFVAAGLGGLVGAAPAGARSPGRTALRVGAGCAVAAAAWWLPGPFQGPERSVPVRDGLQLCRDDAPTDRGPHRVATSWPPLLARLLEGPGTEVAPVRDFAGADFAAWLDRQRVDRVLATPEFAAGLPAGVDWQAPLRAAPWREIARRGDVVLFGR